MLKRFIQVLLFPICVITFILSTLLVFILFILDIPLYIFLGKSLCSRYMDDFYQYLCFGWYSDLFI